MKKGLVIAVTLIAFGCVGVIGCTPSKPPTAPPKPISTPTKAPAPKAATPAPAKPATPPATTATPPTPPATTPQAAAPAAPTAGAALNAQTLVGTTWEAGGYEFAFNANGKLKVNGAIDGTWSVQGNKVKVQAMGQNLEAEIQGNKLMYQGKPLVKK